MICLYDQFENNRSDIEKFGQIGFYMESELTITNQRERNELITCQKTVTADMTSTAPPSPTDSDRFRLMEPFLMSAQ